MRVLVTGGSGVVGAGLLPRLLQQGWQVRLLARGAEAAAREWPDSVEALAADVTRPEQLRGAADGCDAVVHVTGIIAEEPPEHTFTRVNVEGTRHVLAEAARAGVPRFVYLSSLGADRGESPYHQSKLAAETLVRRYEREWVIIRPGNVYGPGDEVISRLLGMHRTLPVIPLIGFGHQEFQPIWHEDLGEVLMAALAGGVAPGVYDVAGDEVTTPRDILERFDRITGRRPLRVPVPEFLASLGTKAAAAAGMTSFPLNESQLQMLLEHNVVTPPERNALTAVFGVRATALDEGLERLATIQPEQAPAEGVGGLESKRFWADIRGARLGAVELMNEFRRRITELMPIDFHAEPGSPSVIVEGATMTAALPMRGNIQIRVQETSPTSVTFATLRGHPLAGVVRFTTADLDGGGVQFTVRVFARAATVFDWLALSTVGGSAQNATWRTLVSRVAELSGGECDGVQHEQIAVSEEDTTAIEAWIVDLITARKRAAHARDAIDS